MNSTINTILKERVIAIVRGVSREDLIPFAEAAYEGGVRVLECTYDATGKAADEEIAQNIKMLCEHFGERMTIGAGTVLNKKQVKLTKKAGGKFIISPDTNREVIKYTKSQSLVSIPGALTPSEAVAAHNAGADFVKIFPITSVGAAYLKDISAPLSHIRFLAVGGVNADNIKDFLNAGAVGVGIGSDIANKKLIAEGKFSEITENAAKIIANRG